jgi:hypothetical protein
MELKYALQAALEVLEAMGYTSGDIHNNLEHAIRVLKARFPEAANYKCDDWPWDKRD